MRLYTTEYEVGFTHNPTCQLKISNCLPMYRQGPSDRKILLRRNGLATNQHSIYADASHDNAAFLFLISKEICWGKFSAQQLYEIRPQFYLPLKFFSSVLGSPFFGAASWPRPKLPHSPPACSWSFWLCWQTVKINIVVTTDGSIVQKWKKNQTRYNNLALK